MTDSLAGPPAGWYPDPGAPVGRTGRRWWDGQAWTEHVVADPPPDVAVYRFTPDGDPVAGIGRRVVAYIVDVAISGVITTLLGLPFVIAVVRSAFDQARRSADALRAGAEPVTWSPYDDAGGALLGLFVVGLVVTVAYHVIFLRWRSATPGKLALGLEVRAWDAPGLLRWGTILRRLLAQFWHVLLQPVPVVGTIAGVWVLADNLSGLGSQQRRTLHDRFAGTVVIDARGAQAARAQQQPGQTRGV